MVVTGNETLSHQTLEVDACRALVRRVIESASFAKSQRLSSFLEFVCELTLSGRSNEINEQLVGQAVFGRSPSYDPTLDGIVRTQASRLRQRLEQYFSEEGSHEPIRIVIPRGTYVPRFEFPSVTREEPSLHKAYPVNEVITPAKKLIETPDANEKQPGFHWPLFTACALVVVLTLTSIGLWLKLNSLNALSAPAKHPLWSQLFLPDQKTLVVPEDNGLVLWEGLMKKNVSLPEFLQGKYREADPALSDSTAKIATLLSRRRYTTVVALEAVQLFAGIANSEKSSMIVRYAREIRPNDLRDNNVVLLGAPEANPWVSLFEPKMNFVFSNDRTHEAFSIVNRHPQGNEPQQWLSSGEPVNLVYALIAYLPAINEKRNALIVAGTAMAGTECALNFITDDKLIGPFLARIRRSDGTIPHFEVVLETHSMGGNALTPSILAWRIME